MSIFALVASVATAFAAQSNNVPLLTRRSLLAAVPVGVVGASRAFAIDAEALVFASGTVVLPRGVASGPPTGALYVTARLASGGAMTKQPPLAAARFACPLEFPFAFVLKAPDDLTAEYAAVATSNFASADLIISARLDSDGVAATREPGDLIGRGGLVKRGAASGWAPVAIELQGRGLTGRILTGK